jgi:hypothetical protein
MDNTTVITRLGAMIDELDERENELKGWEAKLPGPIFNIPAQLNSLYKRRVEIMTSRKDLNLRKTARQRAVSLNQTVQPLSTARAKAMEDALVAVSRDISVVATFKATLSLAANIAEAAGKADAASVIA